MVASMHRRIEGYRCVNAKTTSELCQFDIQKLELATAALDDHITGKTVVDLPPPFVPLHQTGAFQDIEMMGDRRLGHLEVTADVRDTELSLLEELQDLQTSLVPHRLKDSAATIVHRLRLAFYGPGHSMPRSVLIDIRLYV